MAGREKKGSEGKWIVKASKGSHDSINPIRQFEEFLFQDVLRNANSRTDLSFIKLSIGETHMLTE